MKLDPHVQEVLAQLDWLKRLASRETRDCHAADEALQDALVRALQLRPRATAGPQLRSWLRSVLHAVARERVRRDSRRRWRERLAAEPIESASDPLECEATSQLVRRALERVREPYGSAVRLRYFEGLSAAEAALRLEITPDAVRQRVSRGLRILRSELERDHLRGDVHTRRSRLGALLAFVRRQRPRTRLVLGTSLAVIAFAAFIPWLWSGRPAAVSAWPGVARAATSLGQHVAVRPARRARLDSVAQAPARSARPGELPLVAAAASDSSAPISGARWLGSETSTGMVARRSRSGPTPAAVRAMARARCGSCPSAQTERSSPATGSRSRPARRSSGARATARSSATA